MNDGSIKVGDQQISLSAGALSYLVRHSMRDGLFVFKEPYQNEVEPAWQYLDLVGRAVDIGWFRTAPAVDVVTRWAKVDDLKAALAAQDLATQGKRPDLLARCLAECHGWVEQFAATHPAHYPTDLGRIELQATRPVYVPETKESHRQQMLAFLKRDIDDATQQPHVTLGFKVWARTDAMWAHKQCPRASQLAGVYLPDEMPDIYPSDCPDDNACCCTLYEAVLCCDDTPESRLLRGKIAGRGLPVPPPPWEPFVPLTAAEQAETLGLIEKELSAVPEKEKAPWRFLRGIFSKKRL